MQDDDDDAAMLRERSKLSKDDKVQCQPFDVIGAKGPDGAEPLASVSNARRLFHVD